jgi:YidC/Oxa1 family membrane protein insertase
MDRNSTIGFILIGILFIVWWQLNKPSQAELDAQQRALDSLDRIEKIQDSISSVSFDETETSAAVDPQIRDSIESSKQKSQFGFFARSSVGTDQSFVLENSDIRLTFGSKGGFIKEAWLKKHVVTRLDSQKKEQKVPLYTLNLTGNRFDLMLNTADGRLIRSGDLFFKVQRQSEKELILRAATNEGGFIEYSYKLADEGYEVDFDMHFNGLGQILRTPDSKIQLEWVNYLNKLEKNVKFERTYSSVYYKEAEDDPDYCNCTRNDRDELQEKPIKWVSHANQFFTSSLIADNSFDGLIAETEMMDDDAKALKKTITVLGIPYNSGSSESMAMQLYIGPKEFKRLAAFDVELTSIIPFGRSILGTINMWVFRPLFDFLNEILGSIGVAIIILTFFVKLVLYPLTYKMLHSQAKMGALKPEISKIREKNKDDMQAQQMESMKLYREFGVSPFGGCMPMVLQMPIWFALYRFFPGAIEFRQASFLWASDLSTYDVVAWLPFSVPMYGAHVSLFTLLWGVSLLTYTIYNSQNIDMTAANPMMKYMQYLMPVMFLIFLNQYAAGLTCYLLFSNLFNIAQTVITKKFVFDEEKIKAELNKNKDKPKKKGGFQARLEKAMKEQQKIQEQKSRSRKKK